MSKLTPKSKAELRKRRHRRIRARIIGTTERPRLAVFRSNKYVSAQIIDDEKQVTIASATSRGLKAKGMIEGAKLVGEKIAESVKPKGISRVVFDRGGFSYGGVIKALADAARGKGLDF